MPNLTMLLLPLLLAGPADTPIVAKPNALTTPAHCGPTVDRTRGPKVTGSMKLGDQPPAAQVLTVFRKDADGCLKPVVLREGIGANPEKALPMARGGTLHPVR